MTSDIEFIAILLAISFAFFAARYAFISSNRQGHFTFKLGPPIPPMLAFFDTTVKKVELNVTFELQLKSPFGNTYTINGGTHPISLTDGVEQDLWLVRAAMAVGWKMKVRGVGVNNQNAKYKFKIMEKDYVDENSFTAHTPGTFWELPSTVKIIIDPAPIVE